MVHDPWADGRPSPSFELRHASTAAPSRIVVPPRRLLAIDGVGHPRSVDFLMATSVLRTASAILRTRLRGAGHPDLPAAILEIVWTVPRDVPVERIADAFAERRDWRWTQLMEVPRPATDALVAMAVDECAHRSGRAIPLVKLLRVTEGASLQVLDVGAPGDGAAAVRRLLEELVARGVEPRRQIHQLLLAEADRVPAARLRSIVRIPVVADGASATGTR